ncbi:hypothetical protein ACWAT4_36960 [Bradyrhizobium manausense]
MFSLSLRSASFSKSLQGRFSPFARFAPGSRAGMTWQKAQTRKLPTEFSIDLKQCSIV